MPYEKNGLWVDPKPERVIVTKNPKTKKTKASTARKASSTKKKQSAIQKGTSLLREVEKYVALA